MDFETPDFLTDVDVDSIHEKALQQLPLDIDKAEGGFVWDLTRPSAYIAAELLEFYFPNLLQLMFPQWSTGQYLDFHGTMAQVNRREAQYANVELLIKGEPGTIIPAESTFSTATVSDEDEPVEFQISEQTFIGEDGTVTVSATAVNPGRESNVAEGTVTIMGKPITGVTSVTNPAKASGGTDEEDDETFRVRVLEGFASHDESYIGNDADFKKWAESVPGMGTAIVISEWNGPETVKIVCIDANGEAANKSILDAIYTKIMNPGRPLERLAPPNVILTVTPPELVKISYKFKVELMPDFEMDEVLQKFRENLEEYYKTVSADGEVKYTKICSVLGSTDGVYDYTELSMNGSTKNIVITQEQFPSTDKVEAEEKSGVNGV